jgi:hypothetical protein
MMSDLLNKLEILSVQLGYCHDAPDDSCSLIDKAVQEIGLLRKAYNFLWQESPRRMYMSRNSFMNEMAELKQYHEAAEQQKGE